MITLRFVRNRDAFGDLIGRAELGFWATQAEALAPEEGFWLLGARLDGGVAKRLKGYDASKASYELYVGIPVVNQQATEFYAFLEGQIGKPYDEAAVRLLARDALMLDARDEEQPLDAPQWTASALIAAALIVAGVVKATPTNLRLTTPRDVAAMCGALVPLGEPAALTTQG
jgi:hypothetical protein